MSPPKTKTGDKVSSAHQHYTPSERKLFVQILENYEHIIESKQSDSVTIREKGTAWAEISNEYNNSALVSTERTVLQLKKLWTNIKQSQRESLTNEKQARYVTGGGPESPMAIIDPDVALVAPNLMHTAPILFSSNMTVDIIDERREQIMDNPNIINLDSENWSDFGSEGLILVEEL